MIPSRTALLALMIALVTVTCGELPKRSATAGAALPAAALVWPKPPAEARIRFVRNVAAPSDWGVSRSATQRFLDKFTGEVPFRFVRPTSVAVRDKTLYVADPGAQMLVILDPGKPREIVVERIGAQHLASPVTVALGPRGTIFLADSALRQVFVLDGEGRLVRTIGGEGRLSRPAGIAYDAANDRLYVSDSAAHRIVVFTADGKMLQTFGSNGNEPGQFNFPSHLALTKDGNLLVTDSLNYRVQVVLPGGEPVRRFGRAGDGSGDFAAPKGVASDTAGNVYVVDALFDAVQLFASDGTLLLSFSERGTQPGRMWLPNGLFVDAADTIYIADSFNQRIAVFQRVDASSPRAEP